MARRTERRKFKVASGWDLVVHSEGRHSIFKREMKGSFRLNAGLWEKFIIEESVSQCDKDPVRPVDGLLINTWGKVFIKSFQEAIFGSGHFC